MIPTQLTYRSATESDLPFLIQLRKITMNPHYLRVGKIPDDAGNLSRVRYRFDAIEIIENDGREIGMVKAFRDATNWVLSQVQIASELQGRGLGTIIIRRILERAGEDGLPVELHVLKENRAIGLYRRLGFDVVDESDHSFRMQYIPK